MKNSVTSSLPLAFILALALSSCVPLAIGGTGAAVGVGAAQEGGLSTAVSDKATYVKINDSLARSKYPLFRKIDVKVHEGRVLMAGAVPTPDMRVEAVRLAWQAEGVRQVINEITVDEGGGVGGYVTDTVITTSIKGALLADRDVQSINYNVDTVNGTVYFMGIAQDQKELDRVISIARNTKYVTNVVSYVRLRGEKPTGVLTPTSGAPRAADPGSSSSYAPPADNSVGPPPQPEAVQQTSLPPR